MELQCDLHPELYPTSIRAYATIKFAEPIPEDTGNVSTWESFGISIEDEDESINIDFEDSEISVDPDDRSLVTVMWKNPDWDAFPEEFDKLTLDVLKNKKIVLDDDLESTVVATRTEDEDDVIDIEEIKYMVLSSPYDEFEDVILVDDDTEE